MFAGLIKGQKAQWTKVKNLKVGAKICVTAADFEGSFDSGNTPDDIEFDEIVEIRRVDREQVYDIEVEGTHNFVGNGILAHNTYVSGNVGIGDSSPDYKLDVWGTICQDTDSNDICDGTVTSDIRLKKNIEEIPSALDKIGQLRGIYFDWDETNPATEHLGRGIRQVGVIAQEVEKVFPSLVYSDMQGYKMVDYQKLTGVLIEGVKEQQAQIASSSAQLSFLDSRLSTLDSVLSVSPAGNVGIGTSAGLNLFRLDTLGNMTVAGTITSNAGAFDLAEEYPTLDPSIEAADVVVAGHQKTTLADGSLGGRPGVTPVSESTSFGGSTDSGNSSLSSNKNITQTSSLPYIQKSTSTYQSTIIGIISTKPGVTLKSGPAEGTERSRSVTLSGRVPVKVSTENGEIKTGDFLTSSSTPGVAMKAIRPGYVIGKALESLKCEVGSENSDILNSRNQENQDQENPISNIKTSCTGKILSFVNLSWADPNNFLASLSLDNQGNLIAPKIKADKLLIEDDRLIVSNTLLSYDYAQTENSIDVMASLKSIDQVTATNSADIAEVKEEIASQSAALAELRENIASLSAELDLTPPDILYASGSAILANLSVSSEATVSGMLAAYDLNISNTLKSFGQTSLGNTLIAGDLNIDGILSIENGNEINASGTLYLQKSIFSQGIDIFDGKVKIDNLGNITTQGIITASEIKTPKLTIITPLSGPEASQSATLAATIGTDTIPAGQTEAAVVTEAITEKSKVFVTLKSPASLPVYVSDQIAKAGFVVKINQPQIQNVIFNWWIVDTE